MDVLTLHDILLGCKLEPDISNIWSERISLADHVGNLKKWLDVLQKIVEFRDSETSSCRYLQCSRKIT